MSLKISQNEEDAQSLFIASARDNSKETNENHNENHFIDSDYTKQDRAKYLLSFVLLALLSVVIYLYNQSSQQQHFADETNSKIQKLTVLIQKLQSQQKYNVAAIDANIQKSKEKQKKYHQKVQAFQEELKKQLTAVQQQQKQTLKASEELTQKLSAQSRQIQRQIQQRERAKQERQKRAANNANNTDQLALVAAKKAKLQAETQLLKRQQDQSKRPNAQNAQMPQQKINKSKSQKEKMVNASKIQPSKQQTQNVGLVNYSKDSYMTPQLQAISSKRVQKPGKMRVKAGTVSELTYGVKNREGKRIQEVLYDLSSQQQRKNLQQERLKLNMVVSSFQSFNLVSLNSQVNFDKSQQFKKLQYQEYSRNNKLWNFDQYTQELPMCLIVPGYNNNAKFRIQYNLNSIFQQNYTNYFVVIINDASTDNSDFIYRNYLNFYNINKEKYVYIQNTDRKTALQNIYIATRDYCSPDSIVLNVDADDELIGKNVLKIFNTAYQKFKAGVIYSNFYRYDYKTSPKVGFTKEYSDFDKSHNNYRQSHFIISHLRSYRTELFLKIKDEDFKDQDGKFWTSAYDMVMYFPMMEMACGRVHKIQGFHYLYNMNTGLNDYIIDKSKQLKIDSFIRKKQRYNCSEEFDRKMID